MGRRYLWVVWFAWWAVARLGGAGTVVRHPGTPPVRAAEAAPEPQLWTREAEVQVEALLDQYFSAETDAAREGALAEIEKTPLQGRGRDLEQMREAAVGHPPFLKHAPVPWRQSTERGWYNLGLPAGYTPKKAWPLVLALHGMPSNADNLVSFYQKHFPKRGYIVLYPNSLHRASAWPAPDEKRELLKLLAHVGRTYRLDYRRIYCTGASGGGIGTWHWLVTEPRLFAAAISFSAAGTIFDARLARIKGTPFYVHHGTQGYILIQGARASGEKARALGVEIEFRVSEGTGHTPPWPDWERAFQWLEKQPANPVYARPLLEAEAGSLPLGYPRRKPFQVALDAEEFRRVVENGRGQPATWSIPAGIAGTGFVARSTVVSRIVDAGATEPAVREAIQAIADKVRAQLTPAMTAEDRLYALNEVFFQVEGFTLDASDAACEKPEASVVSTVLRTRKGNPLALAGIYCAVAHGLEIPVYPIVTPYHTFARYDDGTVQVNVEMAEAGASFEDAIYQDGYGLSAIRGQKTLHARTADQLLAAQLAALGSFALRTGNGEQALAAAEAALALDSACFRALCLEAELLLVQEKAGEARRLLETVVRTWPAYGMGHYLLARVQAHEKRVREAEAAYRAAAAAAITPLGDESGFLAAAHFGIALLYYEKALDVRQGQGRDVNAYKTCMDALTRTLRHNLQHAKAQAMFLQLGGRVTPR